ncbi:MAG: PLD nuclease N-terminal domain-containing protein [Microbacteriaceae bacterium]|nr:PLD nuclease N-terminal domain-containing protein [Microbacteriaceae bacterium]
MPRIILIISLVLLAVHLYALVDAAMTSPHRVRGVSKPVWIVLVALVPLFGPLMWIFMGKMRLADPLETAPDASPEFAAPGEQNRTPASDARLRELEERLRELDSEIFPGEQNGARPGEKPGSKAADGQAGGQVDGQADGDTQSPNGKKDDPKKDK